MTNSPVDDFLDAVVRGAMASCEVWSPDAELDATVPNWRFHRRGPAAIREEYSSWFADPGQFEELTRIPIKDGEVVRYLLTWVENGVPHAAHQHARLDCRRRADHIGHRDVRWPMARIVACEMQAAQQAADAPTDA